MRVRSKSRCDGDPRAAALLGASDLPDPLPDAIARASRVTILCSPRLVPLFRGAKQKRARNSRRSSICATAWS